MQAAEHELTAQKARLGNMENTANQEYGHAQAKLKQAEASAPNPSTPSGVNHFGCLGAPCKYSALPGQCPTFLEAESQGAAQMASKNSETQAKQQAFQQAQLKQSELETQLKAAHDAAAQAKATAAAAAQNHANSPAAFTAPSTGSPSRNLPNRHPGLSPVGEERARYTHTPSAATTFSFDTPPFPRMDTPSGSQSEQSTANASGAVHASLFQLAETKGFRLGHLTEEVPPRLRTHMSTVGFRPTFSTQNTSKNQWKSLIF